LPMTAVTVWHHVVAFLGAMGARLRPTMLPEVGAYDASAATAPRAARHIAIDVRWEEEQRLLR